MFPPPLLFERFTKFLRNVSWIVCLYLVTISSCENDEHHHHHHDDYHHPKEFISEHEKPAEVPIKVVIAGSLGTPAPDSGIALDFVPRQTYYQVRRYDSEVHLPRSAALAEASTAEEIINAPRLREVVTHHKNQEVYEEQGYEDAAYDHGGHKKKGEHHEVKDIITKKKERTRIGDFGDQSTEQSEDTLEFPTNEPSSLKHQSFDDDSPQHYSTTTVATNSSPPDVTISNRKTPRNRALWPRQKFDGAAAANHQRRKVTTEDLASRGTRTRASVTRNKPTSINAEEEDDDKYGVRAKVRTQGLTTTTTTMATIDTASSTNVTSSNIVVTENIDNAKNVVISNASSGGDKDSIANISNLEDHHPPNHHSGQETKLRLSREKPRDFRLDENIKPTTYRPAAIAPYDRIPNYYNQLKNNHHKNPISKQRHHHVNKNNIAYHQSAASVPPTTKPLHQNSKGIRYVSGEGYQFENPYRMSSNRGIDDYQAAIVVGKQRTIVRDDDEILRHNKYPLDVERQPNFTTTNSLTSKPTTTLLSASYRAASPQQQQQELQQFGPTKITPPFTSFSTYPSYLISDHKTSKSTNFPIRLDYKTAAVKEPDSYRDYRNKNNNNNNRNPLTYHDEDNMTKYASSFKTSDLKTVSNTRPLKKQKSFSPTTTSFINSSPTTSSYSSKRRPSSSSSSSWTKTAKLNDESIPKKKLSAAEQYTTSGNVQTPYENRPYSLYHNGQDKPHYYRRPDDTSSSMAAGDDIVEGKTFPYELEQLEDDESIENEYKLNDFHDDDISSGYYRNPNGFKSHHFRNGKNYAGKNFPYAIQDNRQNQDEFSSSGEHYTGTRDEFWQPPAGGSLSSSDIEVDNRLRYKKKPYYDENYYKALPVSLSSSSSSSGRSPNTYNNRPIDETVDHHRYPYHHHPNPNPNPNPIKLDADEQRQTAEDDYTTFDGFDETPWVPMIDKQQEEEEEEEPYFKHYRSYGGPPPANVVDGGTTVTKKIKPQSFATSYSVEHTYYSTPHLKDYQKTETKVASMPGKRPTKVINREKYVASPQTRGKPIKISETESVDIPDDDNGYAATATALKPEFDYYHFGFPPDDAEHNKSFENKVAGSDTIFEILPSIEIKPTAAVDDGRYYPTSSSAVDDNVYRQLFQYGGVGTDFVTSTIRNPSVYTSNYQSAPIPATTEMSSSYSSDDQVRHINNRDAYFSSSNVTTAGFNSNQDIDVLSSNRYNVFQPVNSTLASTSSMTRENAATNRLEPSLLNSRHPHLPKETASGILVDSRNNQLDSNTAATNATTIRKNLTFGSYYKHNHNNHNNHNNRSNSEGIIMTTNSPAVKKIIVYPSSDDYNSSSAALFVEKLTLAHYSEPTNSVYNNRLPFDYHRANGLAKNFNTDSVIEEKQKFRVPRQISKNDERSMVEEDEEKRLEMVTIFTDGTTTEIPVDTIKYPFYKNTPSDGIAKYSALRYASNPRFVPNKSGGERMVFYESRNRVNCVEPSGPTGNNNIVPKREKDGEWNYQKNLPKSKRILGLGDRILCYKTKFFGSDPLDNPFFKERTIGFPEVFKVDHDAITDIGKTTVSEEVIPPPSDKWFESESAEHRGEYNERTVRQEPPITEDLKFYVLSSSGNGSDADGKSEDDGNRTTTNVRLEELTVDPNGNRTGFYLLEDNPIRAKRVVHKVHLAGGFINGNSNGGGKIATLENKKSDDRIITTASRSDNNIDSLKSKDVQQFSQQHRAKKKQPATKKSYVDAYSSLKTLQNSSRTRNPLLKLENPSRPSSEIINNPVVDGHNRHHQTGQPIVVLPEENNNNNNNNSSTDRIKFTPETLADSDSLLYVMSPATGLGKWMRLLKVEQTTPGYHRHHHRQQTDKENFLDNYPFVLLDATSPNGNNNNKDEMTFPDATSSSTGSITDAAATTLDYYYSTNINDHFFATSSPDGNYPPTAVSTTQYGDDDTTNHRPTKTVMLATSNRLNKPNQQPLFDYTRDENKLLSPIDHLQKKHNNNPRLRQIPESSNYLNTVRIKNNRGGEIGVHFRNHDGEKFRNDDDKKRKIYENNFHRDCAEGKQRTAETISNEIPYDVYHVSGLLNQVSPLNRNNNNRMMMMTTDNSHRYEEKAESERPEGRNIQSPSESSSGESDSVTIPQPHERLYYYVLDDDIYN